MQRVLFLSFLAVAAVAACTSDAPTVPGAVLEPGSALLAQGGAMGSDSADRNGNGLVCRRSTPKGWVYIDDNTHPATGICPKGFETHLIGPNSPTDADINNNNVICTDGTSYVDDDGEYGCSDAGYGAVVLDPREDPTGVDLNGNGYYCANYGPIISYYTDDTSSGNCPDGYVRVEDK
jgi:hypothetical protein